MSTTILSLNTHSKKDAIILSSAMLVALFLGASQTVICTLTLLFFAPIVDLLLYRFLAKHQGSVGLMYFAIVCSSIIILYPEHPTTLPLISCAMLLIRGIWNGVHADNSKAISIFNTLVVFLPLILLVTGVLADIKSPFEQASAIEIKILSIFCLLPTIEHFITGSKTYTGAMRTLDLEKENLNTRYSQIIEMYQVLNHNLKTPLANALGKVEIALLTKDPSRLEGVKGSMISALEKLDTLTTVKKIVAHTNQLDEFLKEWQIAFNHEDIDLDFSLAKSQNIQINEESGIALAIALDIFAHNSKEAGANKIEIGLDSPDSRMMVFFRDNGPGLDEKRLKLFGHIQQSTKGSSGLGTYLAVRLLTAADIEVNYFNRTSGGFEVQLAL